MRRWITAGVSLMLTGAGGAVTAAPAQAVTDEDPAFFVNRADLEFILKQIKISEHHAAGGELLCDDPADQTWTCVPDRRLPYGLRTVDGSDNNLFPNRSGYGSAGKVFPRGLTANFRDADGAPFDADGPGPAQVGDPSSYKQKEGLVFDAEPRIVSNLVADQTAANPAALDAAANTEGAFREDHDNDPETPDRIYIPNVSPDEGLSAPFNSWFTLFGQFFDHGLDLVSKGGSGTVMVPLEPDDPLYDPDSHTNFLALTRATNQPGEDGILGTEDDVQEHTNRTTPYVDQNQTYTSHPSHQVFLREYRETPDGPVPTGRLLDGADGGLANWGEVKKQARDLLGIELDDEDVLNVPLVATDPYGHFIPGENGLPQLVVPEEGNTLVEGSLESPIDATPAIRANVAFLDDIAHDADPTKAGYDAALLDKHYITGDGRGNENIGLSAVHHVFHAEHNRLTEEIDTLIGEQDQAFQEKWKDESMVWDYGERLFQAARFVTEMEYQHLVFEEFARKLVPSIDRGPLNETLYHADVDAAITAEFAHVVYRFGHSMLTDTVAREGWGTEDVPLLDAFLNPEKLTDGGRITPDQGAGAVIHGMVNQVGNGIDEFVVDTLRNNLLGLPLDLATINMVRAREAGVPTLQEARRTYYKQDLNPALKPYESWEDFRLALKHRASIVNFVAAYGVHPTLQQATNNEERRAAAEALVADKAFMNKPSAESGLDDVDFWIGGLAERSMDFGGMLGTTFNVVFENQLEDLQNGDRFYYLTRLQGTNLIAQMEANSFSELIMRNTDAGILPADAFATQSPVVEIANLPEDRSQWPTGLTLTPDGTYRYDGEEHVAMHGTPGDDRMRGGDGDDALWGHAGRDRIEGDVGDDIIHGNEGHDILTDLFGDDVIHAGDGNDAVNAGPGLDLLFGQGGSDYSLHGQEITQSFAGSDTDFVRGGRANDIITGNEGDDWLEGAVGHDLVQGDNALTFQNDPNGGADILFGGSGNDDHDAEGGNDVMLNNGIDRHAGMLGFDWVTHKLDPDPVDTDLGLTIFQPPNVQLMRSRYMNVEGLSGWDGADVLRGRSVSGDPTTPAGDGHELTDAHFDQVDGLRALLGGGDEPPYAAPFMAAPEEAEEGGHDILLGGASSDLIEGRAGDDFIDGDAWLDTYLVGPGGEKSDTMAAFQERVFAGDLSPADIRIVREIRTATGQGDVVDTAVFSGDQDEYDVSENEDGTVVVAHDGGDGEDGTDVLRNIERLQFADGTVDLTGLFERPAEGTVTISDTTPAEDQELLATADVRDPNGIEPGTMSYTWQSQADDGSWVATPEGVEATFAPGDAEVGRALRVVVTFTDRLGTLESVTSEPTEPVSNVNDEPTGPVVSNESPVIGDSLSVSGLEDADGLPDSVSYQWQRSQGDGFVDIPGATGPTYLVQRTDGGRTLRVVASYTDGHGTAETAASQATGQVPAWTLPAAPAIGSATPGVESVTVSWTPPAVTGNAPLTSYSVEIRSGGQPFATVTGISPEETSTRIDLPVGTYRFRVAALNPVGQGPWSEFVTATVAPLDLTAPTVTVRQPEAGAEGVARGSNVAATFSETVVGVDSGSMTLRRVSDGAVVDAEVSMSNARRAVLNPVAALDSQTEYEVSLTAGITDEAGNPLVPTSWRFTTADTTRPQVVSTSPTADAVGVDRNTNVTATFDEPVQGVSGSTMTLSLGTEQIPATVSYDAATRTATLDPNVVLLADRRYVVRLTTGITDASGNTLPQTIVAFTTGGTITPTPSSSLLLAQSPAAGAVEVDRGAAVSMTFATDVRDVNQQTVQMLARGKRLPATVTYDAAARTAKVSPRGKLPDGTKVTVKVAGVRTADGRPVPATSWGFTTRDHTAPKVVKRTKGKVARKAVIRVKLSEQVVNAGKGAVKLRTVAGKRLKADVRWVASKRTLVVDPVKALPRKARIVVRVKAGLRDAAGNTMAAKSWRFTTRR